MVQQARVPRVGAVEDGRARDRQPTTTAGRAPERQQLAVRRNKRDGRLLLFD